MKPIHKIVFIICLASAISIPVLGMENSNCFECHGNKDIKAETEKGASLTLYIAEDIYNQGKHESVDCIQCHQPVSEESFAAIPHQMTGNKPPDCGDCHGRFFDAINKGFSYDIHRGLLPNNFRCDSCHDYHQTGYLTDRTPNPTPHDKIKYSNHYCLICHEKELKATAGTVKELINAHTMLPQMEQHFRSARCVDCHTAPNDSSNHHVLASTETVACTECHSTETLLLKKLYRPNRPVSIEFRFLNQGLFNDAGLIDKIKNAGGTIPEVDPIRHDSDSWRFTNQPLFSHFYVMGATRHKMADRLYVSILCVSAGLILLHLILRGLFRLKRKVQKADFEEVFVNTLQVRIWHWINALLVILLMISGYTMRYVGKGETLIDFAFSIKLHEKAGIFLVACFAFFLLASVLDGNIKNYKPGWKGALSRLWYQLRFYLWGILRGESHPFHPQKNSKFNPLQKLFYCLLMFLFFPVLLISGLLLVFPGYIPLEVFGQPGKWLIVLFHFISAGLFSVFLMVHLYLLTTGDRLSFLIRSMITGYHRSLKSGDQ